MAGQRAAEHALQNRQQKNGGQQQAGQAGDQAQAKLAGDANAVANAQAAQTADQAAAAAYDQTSKYTALPTVGQVIAPGQSLWSVDGKAVPLLVGSLTPWRTFAAGMSPGADVAALNHALIALGMAVFMLPETRVFASEPLARRSWNVMALVNAIGTASIGPVVLVFFLSTFGFATFETTLALFLNEAPFLNSEVPRPAARVLVTGRPAASRWVTKCRARFDARIPGTSALGGI